MLKVVIDTNVIISGIFFGGIPSKILEGLSENLYKLVLSEGIINEYKEVVTRILKKHKIASNTPIEVLDYLITNAQIIDPKTINTPYCDDPDDIIFLQTAIAAKAKYLVSGDKHLLNVGKYKGGVVLKAKDFINCI